MHGRRKKSIVIVGASVAFVFLFCGLFYSTLGPVLHEVSNIVLGIIYWLFAMFVLCGGLFFGTIGVITLAIDYVVKMRKRER